MMTARKPSYEEMEAKLLEAQDLLGALRNHEVDAIIGDEHVAVVRLREVEEALERTRAELEHGVVERTAELARINRQLQEAITEQERTRRKLEESEHLYRELVESANSIIMRTDVEGRITFFNEFAQRFLGYSAAEILGQRLVGTVVPETDTAGAALFEEIGRRPEEHPTSETESVCRQGRRVWISWTHRPIRDGSGRLLEILSVGNDVTPLKEAQASLKESERRLLQAQQIAHLGNWEWDPRDDSRWWSDEAYRLFGVEPGQLDLNTETFLSFVHPEDRERVSNAIRAALDKKQSYAMEFRIVRPDGRERFICSETEFAFDAGGNIVRVMGTTQDITERRQARQQLEQYTGQLRDQAELLDLAHDMIFVHDMDGKIIFWNRGAEQAYGWRREEALGQLSHKLLGTEYSEPLMRITARIIHTGWWEGELVHTTRNGHKVTVATRWALRRAADGRPTAILEIDNDITERKRAEREMAQARRFAENIVNTVQECLIVLDPALRVVSANRSFHETFGTMPGQVEGRPFYTLNDGVWDIAALRGKLRDVLSQNAGFHNFELECTRGLEVKSLVLSALPVRQPAGDEGMILLVIRDVTVYKKQQREIETDKQQLASLTEELMLIEERQRRQIATTLHDSVGQSLAFAKRELGAVREKAAAPIQDSLRQIWEQITDAIRYTRDLMFELSPATLYAFGLEAAVEELAEQFTESGSFACRVKGVGDRLPLSEHVRSMLYRGVRELLVNAAKHAEARNVSVILERRERDVKITVEDDGKGFDTAALDGFSREHGFGLFSIRERLVHLGGQFAIESAEGKGTRITLVGPLDLEHPADQGF